MEKYYSLKFRFYPTSNQKVFLSKIFGCCRFVYNKMIEIRRSEKLNFQQSCRKLTEIKQIEENKFLYEVPNRALQQTLKHQWEGYKLAFKKQNKFPKFKKKSSRQSFTMTQGGFHWNPEKQQLRVARNKGLGILNVKFHRPVRSHPTSITILKDPANRYFVSMRFCDDTIKPLAETKESIGIDLGIKDFVTLSNGQKISNPKLLRSSLKKLRQLNKSFSRKKKGSSNFEKARLKLAKLYAKITDCRKDFLHKLSTRIIRENQTICIENLNIKGMVRNRRLSRAISECGWSEFVRQLEYKADWHGKEVIKIDRFYPSSKLCSRCGWKNDDLKLSDRTWICKICGIEHDRDENAACNILTAGLAGIACGVEIRPDAWQTTLKQELEI